MADPSILEAYFPLVVLIAVVVGFVVFNLVFSAIVGKSRRSRGKGSTYESGMRSPVDPARGRFSIKFFLVAVLFILFDIESVFLIPWGLNLKALSFAMDDRGQYLLDTSGQLVPNGNGPFLLMEMMTFIGILVLGYIFVWKKGGLEWD